MNLKIALVISFTLLVISFFYIRFFKIRIRDKAKQNQNTMKAFNQLVFDLFGAIRDIKILNKEQETFQDFFNKTSKFENNIFYFNIIEKFPKVFIEFLAILSFVAIFIFISFNNSNSNEILTFLSLTVVAVVRSIPAFTGINSSLHVMRVFEPSIKILHNELIKISKNSDVAITIKNSNSDYKPVSPKVFIRLNKINFNFEDNKNNLLNNIDMTIAEGQRVAIIGKTGSGKSTLMQVMLGLLRPTKGEVLYKNDNIFLNLKEWYKNISYVSQNTFY